MAPPIPDGSKDIPAEAIAKIEALVQAYGSQQDYYEGKGYNETELRNDFINPLFEALGWRLRQAGVPPNEREVLQEHGEHTEGTPDYTFRVNGKVVFFIEAKAPRVNINTDNIEPFAKPPADRCLYML